LKVYRYRVSGYRISELAQRSGFPASTLRFYEQAGLLPVPDRTAGGYRSYDDRTVERLKFIARAKELALSLEEIRELTSVWDSGSCARVQEQLTDRLAAKISDADARIADLTAIGAQLREAGERLGRHTPDGPCDDDCGCVSAQATVASKKSARIRLGAPAVRPVTELSSTGEWPIACTLGAADRESRIRQWDHLLEAVTSRESIDGGVRLALPTDAGVVAEAARLAVLEQQCCQFFTFVIELSGGAPALTVRAPAEGGTVVAAVFGAPAAS
jgi:DNA-binding transcriptional MerR regulator